MIELIYKNNNLRGSGAFENHIEPVCYITILCMCRIYCRLSYAKDREEDAE